MARLAPHTVALHGHELSYVDSGSGPVVLFIHGILGSQRQWSAPRRRDRRRPPRGRPRPLRARRLGQADGRLLAQLARRDPARPARPPRHRARHPRRALARRRHRDAVLLPVPRPGGPPRPRLERRPRPGGQPGAALRDAPRRRAGAERHRLGARARAGGGDRPGRAEGRLEAGGRHRRDLARLHLARRPREPARVPRHHARRDRHRRPEHQRPRPPRGRDAAADPDRVGLEGPDDPRLARAQRAARGARTAGWSSSRAPATSRTSTTPTASRGCSASS